MKRINFSSITRWVALLLVILAVVLTAFQLIRYSRIRETLPSGLLIADVPVGGLTNQQAADRLQQAYGVPLEIHYIDSVIQVRPNLLGFQMNIPSMIAAADLQRVSLPFWSGFWQFLWNQVPQPTPVPLLATVSEDQLRHYLQQEISPRYDLPPSPAKPVPGTATFEPGEPGTLLDIDRSIPLISNALKSPANRSVTVTFSQVGSHRPSLENLQILIQQIIDADGFDGLIEMYILDLASGRDLYFAYNNHESIQPGIAFTAASTIKIPIMVSVYRRVGEPTPPDIANLLELMIIRSANTSSDSLMELVLDRNLGPLMVTEDLHSLGLMDSFIAGFFYNGAPLLRDFTTPANSRADINTQPDRYNQTTALDMGLILKAIYQCSENGGGPFLAAFNGEITQEECKTMLTTLNQDRIGVLLQSGLPDGTFFAHKHGWTSPPPEGVIKQISDTGIVYSPGGNYVVTYFQSSNDQIVFTSNDLLVSKISSAIYNYFNLAN